RDKRLDGVHALRDESDRRGMRIVIELKHDAFEEVVLNHLYKHTSLQSTFGAILLAIVNNRPKVLTLLELLQHYISHRREVVLRRTRYLLRKARERAHILEGLRIALDHIDEVIALIRASKTTEEARTGLMARFALSEIQANAILDMRLQRLVGLERDKIEAEYAEVLALIGEYEAILGSEERLMGVVSDELKAVRERYADPRRTRIVETRSELSIRDLVAEEDQVVTLSHAGYVKRVHPDEWRMQKRGGVGKKGMATRDEDFVSSIFVANTHDVLMVFTTAGKVFPLNVYELPEGGRTARGKPIVNLVPVGQDERVTAVVPVREIEAEDERDLLFCSRGGVIKRTPLSQYANIRQGGLIACGVAEGDELRAVAMLHPDDDVDIMLLSRLGQSIRFLKSGDKGAPTFGRTARGNMGMKLEEGDEVVCMLLVPAFGAVDEITDEIEDNVVPDELDDAITEEEPATTLLTVTSNGFGKRTPFLEYRIQGRNGKGIIAHATGGEIGELVGGAEVRPSDQLMIVTDTGRVIRIGAGDVRLVQGRGSKGVRVMRLEQGERIVDIELIPASEDETEDEAGEGAEE
ncbi:MAG: DNA gyrase subunit A, partial [Alphaproteobacteria bacterium]|nr:DNA gyrase subunit A [Alphaproteobacteria bacterium]